MVRARGGTIIYSNGAQTLGVSLPANGGAWAAVSDRNRKQDLRYEDGEAALVKIAGMPIQSWSYKSTDGSVRHLGPMAQDFREAFGLGSDSVTITTTDIDGVNMLAVQALEARTRALDVKNAELKAKATALETSLRAKDAELARIQSVLDVLLTRVAGLEKVAKQ